jgi:hypothetical protein
MADILVIAIIAALILLVLFLAIIADGLEEYFRSLDRRKSAGKNTSQSAHSKWERLSFINGTIIKKRKRPVFPSGTLSGVSATISSWLVQRKRGVVFADIGRYRRSAGLQS